MEKQYDTYIAGVKFRPGAREYLAELEAGTALEHEPEPTNRFDPSAIKLIHEGMFVGYVPRAAAEKMAQQIADGTFDRVVFKTGTKIVLHYHKDDGEANDSAFQQ